ncbi:MAG: hypothetical protein IPM35_03920 [Myxococcales bacterium]|nr:hypothetical protein [Myxococcales bacterium]
MNALSRLALVSLCALSLSAPALAEKGGPPGAKGPGKAAAEAVREKRAELKEKIDEKKAAAEDKKDAAKEEVKEAKKDLKEAWAKLRETRKERRQERREEIKKKWGDLHKHPAVKAELKVHAWRMARLKRIRAVADAEGKTDTVARVDKLIEKEKERHQKHMDTLKSKGGAQ